MAEETSGLKLTKPLETELYDVNIFNDNADKIDAAYISATNHVEYMQTTLNSQQQMLTGSPDVTDARSGSFDFSSRGVSRKVVVYDSTTTFTDAPDLPEAASGESGIFTFEMRYTNTVEDSTFRYTQTVYCFDSGYIFKRDGTQSAWSGWHRIVFDSELEDVKIELGAKATQSSLALHVNNVGIHVDESDKTKWNTAIFSAVPETTLADAANADDYTTDGQYTTTGLDLTTLTNFAQNSVGFELIVMHTVSSNRGVQVMITSQGDVYIRAFNSANSSGAFTNMNWKKLTSEAVV